MTEPLTPEQTEELLRSVPYEVQRLVPALHRMRDANIRLRVAFEQFAKTVARSFPPPGR